MGEPELVVDNTPAKAAKAEVRKEPHVYSFKGETFTFPPNMKALPGRALREAERGNNINFVYALMGDQEARFDALDPTAQDIEDTAEWFGKAYGFSDAGESQASSDS